MFLGICQILNLFLQEGSSVKGTVVEIVPQLFPIPEDGLKISVLPLCVILEKMKTLLYFVILSTKYKEVF